MDSAIVGFSAGYLRNDICTLGSPDFSCKYLECIARCNRANMTVP